MGWAAKAAMQGKPPFEGNVTVSYIFRRADQRRADWENLSKLVSDAMNGIVYDDDSRITAAHVYVERGCQVPETVVLVEAL